ncbi:MAG: hypothetical protein ACRCYR_18120 [Phycicoccus sp.]
MRFLAPFMRQELTVSEAAERLEVSASYLLPRVRRLHRLGLLRILREEPRKGRAVKVYRAATAYHVPLTLISIERGARASETYWHDTWWRSFEAALLAALAEAPRPGAIVRCDDRGRATIDVADDLGSVWDPHERLQPAVVYTWRAPRLTLDRAKRLQAELGDVIEKYVREPDPRGQRYVVGAHLAPLRDLPGTEGL